MREVDWRLRTIIDRSNLERVFTAKIHGVELNIPKVIKESKGEVKVTKDQEQAMEQAFKAAKIRKANGR